MYPKLFGIDFLDSYAIMLILGVIAFTLVFFTKTKKYNFSKILKENLVITFIISGCLMYVGAFVFDTIFHSIEEGKFVKGGITFLGGFITGIITFVILIIKVMPYHKKNLMFFLNIIIIGIVIAHSLGRVGCFLAGCCYGKETTSILGVTFPKGSTAYFLLGPNHSVLPTQLIEAVFLFLLFIVLLIIKKHQFITYLFSYGIFRFILEFFRGDDRGSLFILSPSQWLSIGLIITGIILLIKKPNETYTPSIKTDTSI